MKKLHEMLTAHWDILIYLVFGVLTTLVNYMVYFPCIYAGIPASVSNGIAWVVSVLFAYLTNKPFVFRSRDWSMKTVLPEAAAFFGCRIGSGALESGILLVAVDWLHWNGCLWKVITSVLVVILNYVGSKLFVFRKDRQ